MSFLATGCGNIYKYLDKASGDFYNVKKVLTYGRPWNFITGSRSVGKSTSVAIMFLYDYLQNNRKFIYCRRDQDAVMLTCQKFFASAVDIINATGDFHIAEFYYHSKYYYIRLEGEEEPRQCGTIIPLSLENKYKSSNYSEYFNLVFDEFIEKDPTKYLGSAKTPDKEYKSILSMYQTIDRGVGKTFRNETRFFFLGNTATIYNPLFLKIGIADFVAQNPDCKFVAPKGKLWLLERIETVEALKDIENSYAYQLADEEERAYAYKNTGNDNNDFVKRPDCSTVYLDTLILEGVQYGVRRSTGRTMNEFYIGKPDLKNKRKATSLDIAGHNGVDLRLITGWRNSFLLVAISNAFKEGRLYFDTGKTKLAFLRYLQYMP